MQSSMRIVWLWLVALIISVATACGSCLAAAVPLEILEPAQRSEAVKDYPVSVGLIFLDGEVTSAPGGGVVDDLGKNIPFEWQVNGWWSPQKKSVKWLLLHFKASSDRQYSFVHGADPVAPQGKPLGVESGDTITINTGPLQVHLAAQGASVFRSVALNGRDMLEPGASLFEMVDDEGRSLRCDNWSLTLEENTPQRAVVKADGIMAVPGEAPLAKLSVRYQFFAGEGFVRMYHTFVWMPRSLDPGASRIAMRLKPAASDTGVVRVGRSDYTDDAALSPFTPGDDIVAYQDDVAHYTIARNGSEIATGEHLGGWISVEGADGRGVGVSLKNAWQTYPTALAVRHGNIDIDMWPTEAGRLSFEERDIMPDALYYSRYWKYQTSWSREGGPSLFNTKDLIADQAATFFTAIKAQAAADEPSPGKRIVSLLRPELQQRLRDYTDGAAVSDGFRARIAHGMNAFIKKPDFYDAPTWKNVQLKPKAKELLDKGIANLDEPHLFWLNRLLIESAFPDAISPTDVPHHIHENAQFAKGGGYEPHGQGAARTHEINVLFYDRASSRTPAQINSLTQHPFVMRQSPQHALRAPVFGFKLSPVNTRKYPEIERALDMYGRANVARYAETCDYGFHRFGMQHMNYPGQGLYRWFAGMQYDQQLIPWLLFLRGGDRFYYEEAMNTATYAMDMQTNHYNTIGAPTGYMSFVASMPVPEGPTFSAYNMKVHFLSLCHNLTGYRRAAEVIDLAVEGVKKIYPNLLAQSIPIGRQLYGMDLFCAHAYTQTLDPEMKRIARASIDHTFDTHYDPDSNTFYGNTQYLYRGLLSQYEIFPEPRYRDIMLKHLASIGIPSLELGGPTDNRSAIMAVACGWAYEQTGDERYARIIWDVARNIADTAPDHDWSSPVPVEYPLGHFANYCHRVLPMLVAMGVVDRNQLEFPETSILHDLFVSINQPGSTGTAYVRALKDGDLNVKIDRIITDKNEVSVTAYRPGNDEPAAQSKATAKSTEPFGHLRRPRTVTQYTSNLIIPNAKQGEVYRLSVTGGGKYAGILLICDDAQITHQIKSDTIQFFGHSSQYYLGSRIFVKARGDTLGINRNRSRASYSIRDANTHELLFRSNISDPLTMEYQVGEGRMIELVMAAGRDNYWTLSGVEPYVSARLKDWFKPE